MFGKIEEKTIYFFEIYFGKKDVSGKKIKKL
jgi:hypothetical protein